MTRHIGTIGAVALGGALGTLGRAAVAVATPSPKGAFPWPTLAVNVTGSFLIGVIAVVLYERKEHFDRKGAGKLLSPFLAAGVCGGFTTFSTFANEIVGLARAGRAATAAIYGFVSVVAACVAVYAGMRLGRALVRTDQLVEVAPAGQRREAVGATYQYDEGRTT